MVIVTVIIMASFGNGQLRDLRPRPHVSGSFWKRIFLYTFGFASTRRRRHFRSMKRSFQKAFSRVDLLKRRFPVFVRTDEKGASQKRRRYGIDLLHHIRARAQFFGDHASALCSSVFCFQCMIVEYHNRKSNFEYHIAFIR